MLVHLSHVHIHLLHYWILRVALKHSYHAFVSLCFQSIVKLCIQYISSMMLMLRCLCVT
jgi:hypothetical protein